MEHQESGVYLPFKRQYRSELFKQIILGLPVNKPPFHTQSSLPSLKFFLSPQLSPPPLCSGSPSSVSACGLLLTALFLFTAHEL